MSKPIDGKIQALLRQQAIQAIQDAAKQDNVAVQADALALVSQPNLLFVNTPVAGIEKLDFKAMLDDPPVLDETPVMYWQLSGPAMDGIKGSIPAGFYSVVASQKQGTVKLKDAAGKSVAEGDLSVCIQTPPTVVEKVKVSGGIDSASAGLFPPHVKICGHVTVSEGKQSVTVTACFEAGF